MRAQLVAAAATGGAILFAVLWRRRRVVIYSAERMVLVKLGGSAITKKADFETLDSPSLAAAAADISCSAIRTCVVHGAGSFGHFQARQYGISKGVSHPQFSWVGFAATRQSVSKLNGHVVDALIRNGVAATAMPPFPCWSTVRPKAPQRTGERRGVDDVRRLLAAGLTPVLHGDAVLDHSQGASILSGDTLMVSLASALRPVLAVFLTDVAGVYTRPPTEPNAQLLRRIFVSRTTGAIVAASTSVEPADEEDVRSGDRERRADGGGVTSTTAAHDVTGGLAAKLEAAAAMAMSGTRVVIVQVGTPHAAAALKGIVPNVCTLIERAST